jgi:hypothetical protein
MICWRVSLVINMSLVLIICRIENRYIISLALSTCINNWSTWCLILIIYNTIVKTVCYQLTWKTRVIICSCSSKVICWRIIANRLLLRIQNRWLLINNIKYNSRATWTSGQTLSCTSVAYHIDNLIWCTLNT